MDFLPETWHEMQSLTREHNRSDSKLGIAAHSSDYPITFGKYKGLVVTEVDNDYLKWMYSNLEEPDSRAAEYELLRRNLL